MIDGDRPVGLRCRDGAVEEAELPEVQRPPRPARSPPRSSQPFDRSAALVFFGAIGLLVVLVSETVAAAVVLEQNVVDAFYGGVKTLVTVDPNPEVAGRPGVVQGHDLGRACSSRCCSPRRSRAASSNG